MVGLCSCPRTSHRLQALRSGRKTQGRQKKKRTLAPFHLHLPAVNLQKQPELRGRDDMGRTRHITSSCAEHDLPRQHPRGFLTSRNLKREKVAQTRLGNASIEAATAFWKGLEGVREFFFHERSARVDHLEAEVQQLTLTRLTLTLSCDLRPLRSKQLLSPSCATSRDIMQTFCRGLGRRGLGTPFLLDVLQDASLRAPSSDTSASAQAHAANLRILRSHERPGPRRRAVVRAQGQQKQHAQEQPTLPSRHLYLREGRGRERERETRFWTSMSPSSQSADVFAQAG